MNALMLLLAIHGTTAMPVAAHTGPQVFAELRQLVGDWQGVGARQSLKVSYRMTANDTVLVETWTMSATRESMTLYALDGKELLATHYCPQGNQPRLRFTGVATDGRYQFAFKDASNLQNQQAEHQHAMWVKLDHVPGSAAGASRINRFSRGEIYLANTKQALSGDEIDDVVQFERVIGTKPGETH
jgi:hypothetical protein